MSNVLVILSENADNNILAYYFGKTDEAAVEKAALGFVRRWWHEIAGFVSTDSPVVAHMNQRYGKITDVIGQKLENDGFVLENAQTIVDTYFMHRTDIEFCDDQHLSVEWYQVLSE